MADHNENKVEITPEVRAQMNEMLTKASLNGQAGLDARDNLAKALEMPLREGVMNGDIISPIFQNVEAPVGQQAEWPLHFLTPGTEDEYRAYVIPQHGALPKRHIEGDFVTVPIYEIGASIDMNIKYAEQANWNVVGAAMENLRLQFTKKTNDDGAHTLLAAAVDRNILVFDSDAAPSQFTKRLVSLMKLVMRRNGGGNSSSINRTKLTDLIVSPEAIEDMRNWNVDIVDEATRREIFLAPDGSLNRIFGVNLIDWDEFGENQEYQNFYTRDLGGILATNDTELVLGLDLTPGNRKPIKMVQKDVELFDDPWLHRQRQMGWYGWASHGFLVPDSRVVIAGSF